MSNECLCCWWDDVPKPFYSTGAQPCRQNQRTQLSGPPMKIALQGRSRHSSSDFGLAMAVAEAAVAGPNSPFPANVARPPLNAPT